MIGQAERALEKMCKRVKSRVAFGKPVAEQTVTLERIAEARIMIEQSRLLTLKAAYMMDKVGNKVARAEIAMIKVAAPNMLCKIVDWAIQAHGARRRLRRFRPRQGLCRRPHAAARRRPRRGPPQPDRPHRAAEVQLATMATRRRDRDPVPPVRLHMSIGPQKSWSAACFWPSLSAA